MMVWNLNIHHFLFDQNLKIYDILVSKIKTELCWYDGDFFCILTNYNNIDVLEP